MPGINKIGAKIPEKDYLDGELISEVKHEYIDGYIYAMAGASRKHNLISSNVSRELGNELKQKKSPCEIFSSDMKVRINDLIKSFFYPDVMIACDIDDDYYQNSPIIIIEVLSKSTRKDDKTNKKLSYFNIPSLQEYVIIEQDFCEVEVFRRIENWNSSSYFLGDKIIFNSIDSTISVEDIYYQVKNDDMAEYLKDKEEMEA